MSLVTLLGVGLLGGIGAMARALVDGAVTARVDSRFPLGTLVVNLSGSFALGVLVGLAVHGDAYRLWGIGLIGAYTTFSTWIFHAHRLDRQGRRDLAALNIVGSLVLGVLIAWLGRRIGASL